MLVFYITVSWYSIRISLTNGGPSIFNGYFEVDNGSNLVTAFYETIGGVTNFANNIYVNNGYDSEDSIFVGGNFSNDGTNINHMNYFNNPSSPGYNASYFFFNLSYHDSIDELDCLGSDGSLLDIFQMFFTTTPISNPSCFNEGTLILTKNGYQAIENIKLGDEILTLNQTYKKVTHIVNQPFEASDLKITNYMCKYKCDNFPDLLVTGGHSLMVDELNDVMKEFSKEHTYFNVNAGDKYKLLAGLDDRCEKIVDGVYNIYHLVLENDGDLDLWYWIYSNGIVTETMSEKYYHSINKK